MTRELITQEHLDTYLWVRIKRVSNNIWNFQLNDNKCDIRIIQSRRHHIIKHNERKSTFIIDNMNRDIKLRSERIKTLITLMNLIVIKKDIIFRVRR